MVFAGGVILVSMDLFRSNLLLVVFPVRGSFNRLSMPGSRQFPRALADPIGLGIIIISSRN